MKKLFEMFPTENIERCLPQRDHTRLVEYSLLAHELHSHFYACMLSKCHGGHRLHYNKSKQSHVGDSLPYSSSHCNHGYV